MPYHYQRDARGGDVLHARRHLFPGFTRGGSGSAVRLEGSDRRQGNMFLFPTLSFHASPVEKQAAEGTGQPIQPHILGTSRHSNIHTFLWAWDREPLLPAVPSSTMGRWVGLAVCLGVNGDVLLRKHAVLERDLKPALRPRDPSTLDGRPVALKAVSMRGALGSWAFHPGSFSDLTPRPPQLPVPEPHAPVAGGLADVLPKDRVG